MTTEIWHNPKCTKSRETLKLLQANGVEPKVRLYLDDPPDAATLDRVLKALAIEPRALMRTDEDDDKALKLADAKKTRQQLIDAMVAHPRLIQRPVVVHGKKAAIGRPPESVLALWKA